MARKIKTVGTLQDAMDKPLAFIKECHKARDNGNERRFLVQEHEKVFGFGPGKDVVNTLVRARVYYHILKSEMDRLGIKVSCLKPRVAKDMELALQMKSGSEGFSEDIAFAINCETKSNQERRQTMPKKAKKENTENTENTEKEAKGIRPRIDINGHSATSWIRAASIYLNIPQIEAFLANMKLERQPSPTTIKIQHGRAKDPVAHPPAELSPKEVKELKDFAKANPIEPGKRGRKPKTENQEEEEPKKVAKKVTKKVAKKVAKK